jgi:hypothetical protein
MPLTIEFSQGASDKIFNSGIKKQLIVWSQAADLTKGSPVFTALRAVAKTLKGQLVFVTSNNEGKDHEPITNYFGLKGKEGPAVSCAGHALRTVLGTFVSGQIRHMTNIRFAAGFWI